MSKLSPMKNSKQASQRKANNFKTHKDDRAYGFKHARKAKQNENLQAWA